MATNNIGKVNTFKAWQSMDTTYRERLGEIVSELVPEFPKNGMDPTVEIRKDFKDIRRQVLSACTSYKKYIFWTVSTYDDSYDIPITGKAFLPNLMAQIGAKLFADYKGPGEVKKKLKEISGKKSLYMNKRVKLGPEEMQNLGVLTTWSFKHRDKNNETGVSAGKRKAKKEKAALAKRVDKTEDKGHAIKDINARCQELLGVNFFFDPKYINFPEAKRVTAFNKAWVEANKRRKKVNETGLFQRFLVRYEKYLFK